MAAMARSTDPTSRPDPNVPIVSSSPLPRDSVAASSSVRFPHDGNDKTEAPLTLVGDELEAKGSFKVAPGTKVLVEVALNGKPAVSARLTLK